MTASDIQFLDHYDEDKVHLNAKNTVRDSVPGMKNYKSMQTLPEKQEFNTFDQSLKVRTIYDLL